MNFAWVLRRHAERTPDKEALVGEGCRLPYAQLSERVSVLATGLRRMGVRRGDRVALLLMNCPEFLEGYLAICQAGAIMVPLNFRLAPAEVAYILNDSETALLISEGAFEGTVDRVRGEVPSLLGLVGVGKEIPPGWVPYRELLQDRRETGQEPAPAELDDLQRIMYTSGTTAHPKGVMISHGMVYWKCVAHAVDLGLRPQDRTLVVGPLYHVGGLDLPATGVLYCGGSVVVQQGFRPSEVLAAIEQERVTNVWLAPSMINRLLAEPGLESHDLSSLRMIIDGGEKMPLPLIEKLHRLIPGCGFYDAYGLTETVSGDTFLHPEDSLRKIGSVGRATYQLRIQLVDDVGREVPRGEPGEIVLRGPKVFQGYWRNPEATAQAIREGWFYTGDIGRFDEEGYLYIVDRKKDIIISGGENIASTEVERVLYEHPDVLEAAVVGVPDPRWGEVPKAYVVRRQGAKGDGADLQAFCAQRLAKFKVPKEVEFVEALPRNPSGKVLKRELRERGRVPGGTST